MVSYSRMSVKNISYGSEPVYEVHAVWSYCHAYVVELSINYPFGAEGPKQNFRGNWDKVAISL